MKTILLSGLIVVLCGFTCVVTASPSLSGPTGMAALPNADVVPKGELNISLDLLSPHGYVDTTTGIRLLYGVNGSIEIGLGQLNQSIVVPGYGSFGYEQLDINNWGLNIKYHTPLNYGGFAWSVGGTRQRSTDEFYSVTDTSLYLVGTRDFRKTSASAQKVRGSIGFNWIHTDIKQSYFDMETDRDYSDLCPFAGVEFLFPNGIDLAVDMMKCPRDTLGSIALRVPLSEALQLQVGITEFSSSRLARGNHITAINLNYTFDTLSSKRK